MNYFVLRYSEKLAKGRVIDVKIDILKYIEDKCMHKHEGFSSKIGFVLAAAGSAVGLGNIWRFPYLSAK